MPKPPYPNKAKAERIGGTATMKVLVDENGTVLSTAGVAGHPYLIEASMETACKARFSKVMREGKPAKATGIVIYNFAP
jgi:TonB family protein